VESAHCEGPEENLKTAIRGVPFIPPVFSNFVSRQISICAVICEVIPFTFIHSFKQTHTKQTEKESTKSTSEA